MLAPDVTSLLEVGYCIGGNVPEPDIMETPNENLKKWHSYFFAFISKAKKLIFLKEEK